MYPAFLDTLRETGNVNEALLMVVVTQGIPYDFIGVVEDVTEDVIGIW